MGRLNATETRSKPKSHNLYRKFGIKIFLLFFFNLGFGKILAAEKNFGSMTAAHSLIPNPVYIQNMATSIPTHSHKTILCTYICSIYKFKVFSLHNIINHNTCTMSGQILLCSSVPHACTWKIVFKIQNNELNELSECMLYKMFSFFLKTSQNYKTLFYKIFSRSLALLCLL